MKLILKAILSLYLIFIIYNSFSRYLSFPLDGDLPAIVLPSPVLAPLMNDPFAIKVLLYDSVYANPNRFFAHFFQMEYFKYVPLWLQTMSSPIELWFQNMSSPIDSIYIACAIAKIFIHISLIYLIAIYVTNKKKIWDTDILLVAAITTPLFQTYGYYVWMAIIDHSITYAFAYGLALVFLVAFFLPFFNMGLGRRDFGLRLYEILFLIILLIINMFNGPLNVPASLIICSGVLSCYFAKNYQFYKEYHLVNRLIISIKYIPKSILYFFSFALLVGIYSYYIGRNNSQNLWESLSILERYRRLPHGFWFQYTFKLGQPLLIGMLISNFFIISKLNPSPEARKMLRLLKWFGVLSLVYLLLLPLGGYRAYRENIIRFDTVLPITLISILFYSYSTFYLLKNLAAKYKFLYSLIIIIVSLVYINADEFFVVKKLGQCEKKSLQILANSTERIVFIDTDCSVLNWGKTLSADASKEKTSLLLHWNVLKEQKLYYQK
jgi:hypothetical protein